MQTKPLHINPDPHSASTTSTEQAEPSASLLGATTALTEPTTSTPSKKPAKRPRGRPVGSANVRSQKQIEEARKTGLLPHEILLKIARGDADAFPGEAPPSRSERISAAQHCAQYFAPRLQATQVNMLAAIQHTELPQQSVHAALRQTGESRERALSQAAAFAALAASDVVFNVDDEDDVVEAVYHDVGEA
jgi:hypothetical protein